MLKLHNLRQKTPVALIWRELQLEARRSGRPNLYTKSRIELGVCSFNACGDTILIDQDLHPRIKVTQVSCAKLLKPVDSICSEQMESNQEIKVQSKMSRKNITVAVEGNIGSGKSTLLKHFENLPYCEVIGEPVDHWTNLEGHNALGLLYENPGRWSFSFNMYAQLTRINMHLKPHNLPVKMLERSLYSTRYCFVQNDLQSETINPFEFSVFSQWFDFLTSSGKANLDLIVYLRADPATCYERLRRRSRKEEAGVPVSLIESLHKLHDEWLLEKKYPVPAPVLVLDANHDLDTMKEVYNFRRQEILCGYS